MNQLRQLMIEELQRRNFADYHSFLRPRYGAFQPVFPSPAGPAWNQHANFQPAGVPFPGALEFCLMSDVNADVAAKFLCSGTPDA